MIRIGNVEEAIEKGMFQEKEIVILGAGKDGKEACVTLLAHHASVKCFMDSNAKGKKPSYYGIPVVPEEDAVITPSDVVLLCIGTFSSMCDQEIVAHPFIQRTGTTSTQLVVFDRMRKDFDVLKAIAQKHQIDLGAAVLDFQGVRMPNYLKMDVGIQRSFIGESCDLILPTMFNEWSAVDEGPYEIDEMHLSPQGGTTSSIAERTSASSLQSQHPFQGIWFMRLSLSRMPLKFCGTYANSIRISRFVRSLCRIRLAFAI